MVAKQPLRPGMGRSPQGWFILFALLALLLSACGSLTPKGQAAQQEQAKLNTMLQQAAKMGVPASLLTPIRQQEQHVADGLGTPGLFGDRNPDSAYASAITSYRVLESEVASVTAQATQTAFFQANQDIQAFGAVLQERQNQGFAELSGYQARLTQAEQNLGKGQTPDDYSKVSAFARQQTEALQLMAPAYQQLQSFQATIKQMQGAGLNTTLAQQEYQNDQATFRAASLPEHYEKLMALLSTQLDQLAADQVAAIPYIGRAMLDQFQQQIEQAQTFGADVTQYQQQLEQDRQVLKNARTLQAYLNFSTQVRAQMGSMQQAIIRYKTNYDLEQLQGLIGQTDINNDYEYRDADGAYLQEKQFFQEASTQEDYQTIDTQVQILLTNLQALLTNLKDSTPHDQAHATDLQLMQKYNLMTGKVMVTSLTEQTLRLYVDGKLVNSIYVVTGQRAAQTPPGVFHIFYKDTNLTFKSPFPKNSPLWYPDTPINYGMQYRAGGYFYHDTTWRSYYGPGANLPHPDYTSGSFSNNGTHGCIGMSLKNTIWLYNWVELGTPAIIY